MKRTLIFLTLIFLTGCGFRLDGTPPPVPTAPIPEIPTAPVPHIPTAPVPVDPEQEDAEPVTDVIDPVWETAVTACAAAERDEVCQDGQTTALAQVNQVKWGVIEGDAPLLRLAADLDEDEGALTLVGLGAGQIVELTTLVMDETAVPIPFAPTDEELTTEEPNLADVLEPVPQQITFFSEPGTAESPSGLLLAAPPSALFTSLGLNGTQVTLVGSAWAEASPGGNLSLTVLSGDVMLSVAGETAVAGKGAQITVPISPDGLATGTPQMVEVQSAAAAPLTKLTEIVLQKTTAGSGGVEDDLITPLVPPDYNSEDAEDDDAPTSKDDPNWLERKLTGFHYRYFLRSYNRCMSDRPDAARYVYNTAYYLRIMDRIPFMHRVMGESGMARLMDMARQCATFDVDFGSTMVVNSSEVTFAAELKAENVHVQFTPGGGPFQGDIQTLQYRSLTESGMDVPKCTLSINHPDGTLRIDDGLLAIQENGLRLRLNILPDVPQESFVYTCAGVSTQPSAPFNWFPLFMGLYADIFSQKGFTISDWHYVGGKLMAEAILDRTMTLDGATLEATTYLVLVHNP